MRDTLLNDLRKVQIQASGELLAAMDRARKAVAERARNIPTDKLVKEDFRRAFYGQVSSVYDILDKELTAILKDATEETVNLTREAAIQKIRNVGGAKAVAGMALKFNPDRMKRYLEFIQPENAPSLAAVFTQKMAEADREALRGAVLKSIRQGEFEGWTARERMKNIQSAWDAAAGDLSGARFVDRTGKAWENARYLQMLVRTTQSRLHRESYIDTIVEHGDDLMRIVAHGDNCPACQAWDGIIISVTGTNPDYPSYDDALDGGVFHPNCDCTMERVDETIDAKDSEKQAGAKNAGDWEDIEDVESYRERAGLPPPSPNGGEPVDFSAEAMKAYKRARRA